MYNVKVPEYFSNEEKKSWEEIITINDMEKVMEVVGISSFTNEGYDLFIKESSDFFSKILSTTYTYMQHNHRLDCTVEDVCYALKFHNLKFYGVGTMCNIRGMQVHPTEFLTLPLIGSAYSEDDKAGEFYERTNLVENYKNSVFAEDLEEESYYDSAGELEDEDDERSTSSIDLDLKPYCHQNKTSEQVESEIIQELQDAQEAVDELEGEEEPLGETDDEEEGEDQSSFWECANNLHCFKGVSTSPPADRRLRIFSRKKINVMIVVTSNRIKLRPQISPAAIAILHQVFETYICDLCADKKAVLRLQIEKQVLMERVKSLESKVQEVEDQKQESRKRPRESLQSHFDIIDLTGTERRVSP